MTEDLTLGVAAMDETHADFIQLLDKVKQAQGRAFLDAFAALTSTYEILCSMRAPRPWEGRRFR